MSTAAHQPTQVTQSTRRVPRFDIVQRGAHWATAALFVILMATALALYFPSLGALVGRRELVAQVHLWAGIALPVPILVALVGPWGSRFRADVVRINRWTSAEIRWLRTLGRSGDPVVDKFNPGQKLNAIFVGSAIVVMLATGFVLRWFGFFPLSWRTGATLVHDLFALAVFVVVTGHVLFAITHPEALRSMIRGWVGEAWARRHAPGWLGEVRSEEPVAAQRATPDRGPASRQAASQAAVPGPPGRGSDRAS